MLPTPWSIFGRQIHSRATRAATVLALFAGVCLTCVAVVWASYGFRFAPTPDPSIEFNILGLKGVVAEREIQARNGNFRPTPAELSAWKPGPMVAAALFANDHKLLPQTFLAGLLYTHASTQVRDSYLMGQFSATGWWYYFPVAMVIKTPLPTLAAMTLSACWGILLLRRSRPSPEFIWTAICPLVFILIYLALAVRTNLNIGMRHMLPIYPPMAVLCGLAAAQGWSLGRRWLRAGIVVLPVLLAIVAVRAWPNYIPYMNALAGDDVGRLHWLGDSNLDWGQDLQTLAQWRATHPEGVLYFCYFGNVDPERYEIAYEPIVGTLHPRDREVLAYARMTQTGYVAVSASQLQGIYLPPADRAFFRRLLRTPPVAVIGGSIFVWRWPGMPSTD